MRFKTLCAVVAGLTIGTISSGCMFTPKTEYSGKIGNEKVTQTWQMGGECSPFYQWRQIKVRRLNGSEIQFVDNDADKKVDYFARFDSLGDPVESWGDAMFSCAGHYGKNGRKVSPEHQKEFEKYFQKVRIAQID